MDISLMGIGLRFMVSMIGHFQFTVAVAKRQESLDAIVTGNIGSIRMGNSPNQSLKPSPLRVAFQSPGSGQEFAD